MVFTKSCLKGLDVIQNTYLRRLFQWNNSVATAATWGESGLLPPSWQIWQRKLRYLKYLNGLNSDKLVKKAFGQQQIWANDNDPCHINSWWESTLKIIDNLNMNFQEVVDGPNIKRIIRKIYTKIYRGKNPPYYTPVL